MKYLATLVLFLVFINSKAQVQELLTQNEWYLYTLNVNDEEIFPPVNSEMPNVDLNFIDFNSDIIFEAHACNTGNGVVIIDEENYSFSFVNGSISITLLLCELEENNVFDGDYFEFFYANVENPFEIGIVYIDDPYATEELIRLDVISANGDFATYHNWILANDEFSISKFKLFPNPVSDRFYISSSVNNNMTVMIYDVIGKAILSKKDVTSNESVNIEDLKAGVYFVSISDEQGITSVERLIKK